MTAFVWSDTHFNHAGIIRHASRPFATVEEMNEALIERWNAAVGPRDTIYLLGDFGFGKYEELHEIFRRLNGRKHLVEGNHDEHNPAVLKQEWETQTPLTTIRDNGMRFVACHYPLASWKNAHKGYVMLHGHSHGTLRTRMVRRYDVGVDSYPDGPVALDFLWRLGLAEPFQPVDHHKQ